MAVPSLLLHKKGRPVSFCVTLLPFSTVPFMKGCRTTLDDNFTIKMMHPKNMLKAKVVHMDLLYGPCGKFSPNSFWGAYGRAAKFSKNHVSSSSMPIFGIFRAFSTPTSMSKIDHKHVDYPFVQKNRKSRTDEPPL